MRRKNCSRQPDVLVICDHDKERWFGCFGAPDLVVEVLSPSTIRKDLTIKLHKYLNAGVKEYWVVNSDSRQVTVYKNDVEAVRFRTYSFTEKIPVGVWEDKCLVDLSLLLEEMDYLESIKH